MNQTASVDTRVAADSRPGETDDGRPGASCLSSSAAVHGDERGSGTVLMAGVCAVTMILGLVLVVVCGYLIAIHRARAAADLAALSGATAASIGGDPCEAARRNSTSQRARVDSCQRVGDQIDFLVTVTASVSIPIRLPGLPTRMATTAHAGAEDVLGSR